MNAIPSLPQAGSPVPVFAGGEPTDEAQGVLPCRIPPQYCEEMACVYNCLRRSLDRAEGAPSDSMIVLRLADLRSMNDWGILVRGEPLDQYFDLGSLDDVVQSYPVTLSEARELEKAMQDMMGCRCGEERPKAHWKRAMV